MNRHANNVTTIGNLKSGINLETARQIAPAAFSDQPSEKMSERYAFIKTSDLAETILDSGWKLVSARQDNPRKRNPFHVAHALDFIPGDGSVWAENDVKLGSLVPRIVLRNSHNGRTAARIQGGMFRLICLNGMMVGDSTTTIVQRHSGEDPTKSLRIAMEDVSERIRASMRVADLWRGIELTAMEANFFAREALHLRFPDTAGSYDVADVLRVRRDEDRGLNLWNVFNRVQENLTAGGLTGTAATGRAIRSRPLTNIAANLDFNVRLWAMAESRSGETVEAELA